MKKFAKAIWGVTLLEIMLVLAIAAMIIVMSIKYYQSAQASQQATTVISTLTAITAAADAISQGTNSYSNVNSANIQGYLSSSGGGKAPWGATIGVSGSSGGGTSYVVTVPDMPAAVCGQVYGAMSGNPHITGMSACSSTASQTFTYTYTAYPST